MLTEDDFARAIRLAWRGSPDNDRGLSVAPLSPLTLDFLARGAFGLHSDEIKGLRNQVRAELIDEAKAIARLPDAP